MNNNNILSIDAALKGGYAIYNSQKQQIVKRGNWRLSNDVGDSLIELDKILTEIIKKYNIGEIVAEDIYLGDNTHTFKRLAKYQGIIEMICKYDEYLSEPIFIAPKDIKNILCKNDYKFELKGQIIYRKDGYEDHKRAMIKHVNLLGYMTKDDNEADAIGLMLYYLRKKHITIKHPVKKIINNLT